MKPQVVYIRFQRDGVPTAIKVERHKYSSRYYIYRNMEVINEDSIKRVDLKNVLFDVARVNGYLPYCDLCLMSFRYEYRDANVEIYQDESKNGSWHAKIVYKDDRPEETRIYPNNFEHTQYNIANDLADELGIPESIDRFGTDADNFDIYE